MEFAFRNVNDAFYHLVEGFQLRMRKDRGRGFCGEIPLEHSASRYGDVWYIQEPVLIHYQQPRERVLLNKGRDANPFFHLYEALWMLAGRNDVAPLKYYNSRMDEFSDDGKTFNGAYGHRWRNTKQPVYSIQGGLVDWRQTDQLKVVINHLKSKPESRRAVLQMWNVEDDLLKLDESKDVCCNLNVKFALRHQWNRCPPPCNGRGGWEGENFVIHKECQGRGEIKVSYLDMTVDNRSNDLVWGLLGANYVHFTMLQEYMAAHIGVEVGKYYHQTNNLHAYTKTWQGYNPTGGHPWLDEYRPSDHNSERYWRDCHSSVGNKFKLVPLVKDPQQFDRELLDFVGLYSGEYPFNPADDLVWQEPFLWEVALPMCRAFGRYKEKNWKHAEGWLEQIKADDWRVAATQWIQKRREKHD